MHAFFVPNSLPALIGSIPLRDHREATSLVLKHTPQIPLWVQLPAYSEEGMIAQFLPGMPGYIREGERDFVDTQSEGFEQELLAFYEEYMAVTEGKQGLDETRFALGRDRAEGFHVLLEMLQSRETQPVAVKGQITGPITFATGVKDEEKKAVFYDMQLRDAAVKLLGLKAAWQTEKLSELGLPVIVFFDEPALAGFGSSEFISISKQEVLDSFAEVIGQVHGKGGMAGIHVCANADWSLVLDSEADILSFDAYAYFDKLLIYADELKRFLQAGKILAWGIVPTQDPESIDRESADSLLSQLREKLGALQETTGLDERTLLAQALITPSCGTGSLDTERAEKVLRLTRELSDRVREML
jgi:methionine synthase II (cobalamin-independent)